MVPLSVLKKEKEEECSGVVRMTFGKITVNGRCRMDELLV